MDTVVYYCWTCEKQLPETEACHVERHYETGREIRFCSPDCHIQYLWLESL